MMGLLWELNKMIQCLARSKYSRLASTIFTNMILHHEHDISDNGYGVSVYFYFNMCDNFQSHNFHKNPWRE